jgi:hypothetical protein
MNKHNRRKEARLGMKRQARGHSEQGHLSLVATNTVLTMGNESEKEISS